MKTTTPPHSESKKELSPDIIAAYQAAVGLVTYESQLVWQATSVYMQFAILLVAGAIFPWFIGSLDVRLLAVAGFVLSLLGIASTMVWWSMVGRSRTYYHYWMLTARELERYLSGSVQTLQRGAQFAEGNTVTVDGESVKFKFGERIRMRWNLFFIYGTFLLVFMTLFVVNLLRMISAF